MFHRCGCCRGLEADSWSASGARRTHGARGKAVAGSAGGRLTVIMRFPHFVIFAEAVPAMSSSPTCWPVASLPCPAAAGPPWRSRHLPSQGAGAHELRARRLVEVQALPAAMAARRTGHPRVHRVGSLLRRVLCASAVHTILPEAPILQLIPGKGAKPAGRARVSGTAPAQPRAPAPCLARLTQVARREKLQEIPMPHRVSASTGLIGRH